MSEPVNFQYCVVMVVASSKVLNYALSDIKRLKKCHFIGVGRIVHIGILKNRNGTVRVNQYA